MKKFTKMLALIMCMVMCVMAFAACGNTDVEDADKEETSTASDYEYIKEKGEMVIGYTVYKPMNYTDDEGDFVGFDTEYAEAVCAYLGITPVFQLIDWETKEVELNAKTIDCIWNGFTVNDDRRKEIEFSDEYISNKQVAVIRKADAEKYNSIETLATGSVIAEAGSAGETVAQEKLTGATYVPATDQQSALLEVLAQTSDIAIIDYVMAAATLEEGTDFDSLMIVDVELAPELVDNYAVGFRLGSDMAAKVNEANAALKADGTIDKLLEKYKLEDVSKF